MKLTFGLCAVALVFCFFAEAADFEKMMEHCEPGKKYPTPPGYNGCGLMTCGEDGKSHSGVGCGQMACPGKIKGWTGDPSKGYPDCCRFPICDDSVDEVKLEES